MIKRIRIHCITLVIVSVMVAAAALLGACTDSSKSAEAKDKPDEWEYKIDTIYTPDVYIEYAVLLGYLGSDTKITVPSEIDGYEVAYIGTEAFAESDIESIELPDTVEYISEKAFFNCRNLKNIKFSNDLLSIGSYAFSGCTSIEKIDIPNSVEYISSYAFKGCTSLKEINIPESCIEINVGAFADCTSLEYAHLPNVSIISGSAFENCISLSKIYIPEDIYRISTTAFNGCSSLDYSTIPQTSVFDLGSALLSEDSPVTLTVPEGSTEIMGFLPISKKQKVERVILPEGLLTIQHEAFDGCTSLSSINLPGSLLNIGFSAFTCCAFEEITVPRGVKRIELMTFADCRNLKRVTLEEGIEYIGYGAFINCTALEKFVLPYSMNKIDERAFEDCTSLKEITIPVNVTYIADDAFEGCSLTMTIICEENSYAHKWANEHGFKTPYHLTD